MLNWNIGVLTKKGKALLAKAQAGRCGIEIVKAQSGNGVYNSQESLDQSISLKSAKQTFAITKFSSSSDAAIVLKIVMNNVDLREGYDITEFGVFAKDPDEGEILYSIATAETSDRMPAYNGISPCVINMSYCIEVLDSKKVTINNAGALALQADLEKLVARVTRIEQSKAKLLGARRKCNSSSTAWERFGDTADMVCQAAIGNADVRNDMMNEYPFNSMKPCNLAEDVTVNAYLGDPAFQWNGSNGDVMLEVPMCYTGRWFETDNNGVKWEYRAVSSAPINHLHLDHAFTDGESRRISEKIYIPIFNGSISSDGTKLESKANAYPVHNKNRDQFRQLAKKKGANWYLDDVWAMHLLDTFFIVMFADTNAQKILGNGQSSLPVSDADGKSLKARTGNYITVKKSYGDRFKPGMGILIGTNSIWGARLVEDRTVTKVEQSADTPDATDVYFDGEQAVIGTNHVLSACCQKAGSTIQMTSPNGKASEDVNAPVRFLWIEDWYGNGWQFRDGDNIKNWQHYYCNTRAAYADKKHDQEYFKVGYEAAHTNGYVKEFGYDPEWPEIEICTDATGSSNTYFPDYYAQAEGGEVVLSGGSVFYGTNAGPFCRGCSNGAGDSNWDYLGRPQARK